MQRIYRPLLTLVVLSTIAQPAVRAQSVAEENALTEIAAALTRIARVMEQQLEGGRLELLIQRVESSERRLERVDERLRREQNYYDGQLHERSRLENLLENLADPEKAQAMGYDSASLDLQTESLEFELEIARRRVADLEGKISRLRSDRARYQREVDDWQAFIDRELTGLQ